MTILLLSPAFRIWIMEKEINKNFEQFMDVIIRLFESKNNMKTLLDAKDYDSFLEKLSKIARSH